MDDSALTIASKISAFLVTLNRMLIGVNRYRLAVTKKALIVLAFVSVHENPVCAATPWIRVSNSSVATYGLRSTLNSS